MQRLLAAVAALAAVATSACQSATPVERGPQPAPIGEFRGSVSLDGAERPAALTVAPSDDGLRAVLHVTDETLAFGEAEWRGGTLYIGLDYAGASEYSCPGRVQLVTDPTSVGITLTGDLHARDCTGSVLGSFYFGLYSHLP